MQTHQSDQAVKAQDDLNQVMPRTKIVTINGQEFEVCPFKIGRLPQILIAVQPLMHMLMNRVPEAKIDVSSMLLLYADDCLNLIAVLAKQPREWVDELEQDEAVELLAAQLEVNIDFFVQRVLPLMKGAIQNLLQVAKNHQALKAINGQTASASLSPMDTASTPS